MTTVFDARDLLAFPSGNNASDTILAGLHFNLTTLEYWNYTLYSNGTMSNGSKCFLTFEPYAPKLLYPNGTFINATNCYEPINGIALRAEIGIALAVVFGLMLVFVLMSLRKHGRRFLPAEKRFRPVGRRWQWYWAILTCACALISLFMTVDVDRYYLPQMPIVLTSFFWLLMELCTLGIVWEAVRHWGSWMERQFIDPNPFALPQEGPRARFEFFAPLVFYLFWWLNFFLVVPQSWGRIEKQRSPEQIADVAAPAATNVRFKIAAFMLVAAWLVIISSLRHSMHHYLPRQSGLMRRVLGVVIAAPPRLVVLLVLAAAMIAYQVLGSWEFRWSVLRDKGDCLPIYLGGYAPSLLIIAIQCFYAWITPNEDRELIRQRRLRGEATDRELGIVHKPAWWRRANGDVVSGTESMRDRIARNVREIGGGRATTQGINQALTAGAREADAADARGDTVEMNPIYRAASATVGASVAATRPPAFETYSGRSDRRRTERTMAAAASMLFPSETSQPTPAERRADLMQDAPPPPYREGSISTVAVDADSLRGRARQASTGDRPGTSERSNSTGTLVSLSGPQQQVRSMLDV